MILKLQTRSVYGRLLAYPMCDVSKLLSRLGKRRKTMECFTFTEEDIRLLKKIGYEIEEVPQFGKKEGDAF